MHVVPCGLVVRIWRFHRRGRGSIPCMGVLLLQRSLYIIELCFCSLALVSMYQKMGFACHPDSDRITNRIAQCESSAHRSCPHCIVWNRIHACTLTSSGHTSTRLPWRSRQIFTSASRHIASLVTVRSPEKRAHCRYLTHECACHALFGPHAQRAIARSRSIQIETTSGSGLGLIWIRSRLGECAFSVDTLKPASIRFNAHWVNNQVVYQIYHVVCGRG